MAFQFLVCQIQYYVIFDIFGYYIHKSLENNLGAQTSKWEESGCDVTLQGTKLHQHRGNKRNSFRAFCQKCRCLGAPDLSPSLYVFLKIATLMFYYSLHLMNTLD